MAKLTGEQRKKLPVKAFALPGGRYPIEDRSHAANALSRVSQFGSPKEKAEVRRKVHAKYPTMGGENKWAKAQKYETGGELEGSDDQAETEQPTEGSADIVSRIPAADELNAALMPKGAAGPADSAPPSDIQSQLQDYLNRQRGGNDAMAQLAALYKDKLAKENDRPDLSGLNALTDYYYGTNLSKTFQRPLKPAEQAEKVLSAQQAVDKDTQAPAAELLKEFGQESNAATKMAAINQREQAAYWNSQRKLASDADKQHKQEDAYTQKFHDDVFFKRGTPKDVQSALGKLQRATSAVALMDQIPESGPIPSEMTDIATSLAGLVTNGNMVTNERLESILPKNVELTAAGIKQWLLSEPQGADQQAFLKRFRREIDAEVQAARNQLFTYQDAQADSYLGKVPEAIRQQMHDAGRRFVDHAYYNPGDPSAYLGQKAIASKVQAGPPGYVRGTLPNGKPGWVKAKGK